MRDLWVPIAPLLVTCFISGCSHTYLQKGNVSDEIASLQQELSLVLASKPCVLFKDVGERDPEFGAVLWLLHFPDGFAAFQFTEHVVSSVKAGDWDTEEGMKHIKHLHPNSEQVAGATAGEVMGWETERYEYRGHLLRTEDGDYLIVERYNQFN